MLLKIWLPCQADGVAPWYRQEVGILQVVVDAISVRDVETVHSFFDGRDYDVGNDLRACRGQHNVGSDGKIVA